MNKQQYYRFLSSPPNGPPARTVYEISLGKRKYESNSDTEIDSVDSGNSVTEEDIQLMESVFNQVSSLIRQNNWQEAISLISQHDYGVNILDGAGNAPLHVAIMNGRVDAVIDLLSFNADPNLTNSDEEIPLNLSIMFDNVSSEPGAILRLLLNKRRTNTDLYNDEGERPLHLAAYSGRVDLIRMLLDRGAGLNLLDDNENNALHHATMNYNSSGAEATVEFLLSRGINSDIRNMQGNTALHYAADSGDIKVIKALLRLMADANIKNEDGNTPLHMAAMNGNMAAVRLLVHYGGDFIVNNAGNSAADLAATDEIRDFIYQALVEDLSMTGDELAALIYGDDVNNSSLVTEVGSGDNSYMLGRVFIGDVCI